MSGIFPGGGSWPAGYKISVSGTLTIDQSTTFDNLEFILGSGAKILVTGSGTVLTSKNNTRLHGCGTMTMWRGMSVQSGGRIVFENTRIEDAWVGLTFTTSANIASSKIDQSTLEDNMTGIYYAAVGSSNAFKLASFSGNKIKRGAGALLPPPTGATYPGEQAWRGIFLSGAKADFASNAAARNEISGQRYGIMAHNSTLTVANMTFSNAVNDNAVNTDTLDGTDIYAFSSTVNVGGALTTNCIFSNAANSGIISRSTKGLVVTKATFTTPLRYGIRCPQSIKLASPIIISENTFNMGAYPVATIFVERPPSNLTNVNTLIKGNVITYNSSLQKTAHAIMIDVQGKTDATDAAYIEGNTITVLSNWRKIHGIRITGKGNNYNIFNVNDLSWAPSTVTFPSVSGLESRGIIANDLMGSNNFITDNLVETLLNTGTGQSFLKSGIFLDNNPFSLAVCENSITNSHYNIRCSGTLSNTTLTENLISNSAYGLYCKAATSMPAQDLFENRWTGSTYVTRGAEYEGGAPGFKIFYDPSNTIPNDKPAAVFPTSGWFQEKTGSNPTCGSGGGNIITEAEQLFIDGTTGAIASAGNWDTRRLLLYKLMRYPELPAGDLDAADYLDDNESANTSAWRFARAEHLFDQAYASPGSLLQSAFSNTVARFHTLSDSLILLDGQQASDTTTYDTTIAQQRYVVFGKWVLVADSLDQLRTQADVSVQPALDSALTYAQSLPDTSIYEENLKAILTVAIRYAQGDSLTESDYPTLRSIAAQCPATGGISIRRAVLWLDHEEAMDYLTTEWDDNCISPLVTDAKDVKVAPLQIQVNPNPASTAVRVSLPEKATGIWQVSDLSGNTVQEGNIDGELLNIGTAGMDAGLYLLRCRFGSGDVSTVKFSIIH
jgi:hypothetical protein